MIFGITASSLTFIAYIICLASYYIYSKNNRSFGGYLAHVGVGFMMIGIIISSVYEKTDKISLPLGTSRSIMGYTSA